MTRTAALATVTAMTACGSARQSTQQPATTPTQTTQSASPFHVPAVGRASDIWQGAYPPQGIVNDSGFTTPGGCADPEGHPFVLPSALARYDLTADRASTAWPDVVLATPDVIPGKSVPPGGFSEVWSTVAASFGWVSLSGLVCPSDGSLVFGEFNGLYSMSAADANPRPPQASHSVDDVKSVRIAGTAEARDVNADVPETADAATFPLTMHATPIGQRSDGSIVVLDGTVVWALKDGRLTRLYRLPGKVKAGDDQMPLGIVGAVTSDGSAYFAPWDASGHSTLGGLVALGRDGTASPVRLPSSVPGMVSAPGGLRIWSMVSDGGTGLYVRVGADITPEQYVLHLHDGQVDIIAASHGAIDTPIDHTLPSDFDARQTPGFLPSGLVRTEGMLLVAGQLTQYDVAVGVK